MTKQQAGGSQAAPKLVAGLAVLVVVGGFLAMWLWPAGQSGADPSNPDKVALGEQLYAAHCASCHGSELQGEPNWKERGPDGALPAPPHDESGHTWHHADAQLFQITKHGLKGIAPPDYVTKMPAFEGSLSDDEIWAVLSFIKSRWPDEIRERQSGLNRK